MRMQQFANLVKMSLPPGTDFTINRSAITNGYDLVIYKPIVLTVTESFNEMKIETMTVVDQLELIHKSLRILDHNFNQMESLLKPEGTNS